MAADAGELARRLAGEAEAVCRHYLSNGRRQGRYWTVGDVRNSPGRSMFVRLTGPESGRGAAGRWTDAATGEHGDLLDIIGERSGVADFADVAAEAPSFLGLRRSDPRPKPAKAPTGSSEAARRLFAMARPIEGTLVETYLRGRGIVTRHALPSIRFHPRCYYRPYSQAPRETWPAMIAAVTDLDGTITGVHRTWLTSDGTAKAPLESPRRAMGALLGHAVRFGSVCDVLAAGEGIETMLALRTVLPRMPMAAALSAAHLAAISFPAALRRLYIAHDNDPAGDRAMAVLRDRARAAKIEAIGLSPRLGDFNEDLLADGADALRARVRFRLAAEDVVRFLGVSGKDRNGDP